VSRSMPGDVNSYYGYHFPTQLIHRLFTRGSARPENRAFDAELDIDGKVIWRRSISCATASDLKALMLEKRFKALHLGAIFDMPARLSKNPRCQIVGREVVFDLDLTDVTWLAIERDDQLQNDRYVKATFASAQFLIETLKLMFNYEHFMPVYSGRRGVHVWVFDERCVEYSSKTRSLFEGVSITKASAHDNKIVSSNGIRDFKTGTLNPCFPWKLFFQLWDQVIVAPQRSGGVGLLDKPRDVTTFVCKYFDFNSDVVYRTARQKMRTSVATAVSGKIGKTAFDAMKEAVSENAFYKNRLFEVQLSLLFPRIDAEVTKSIKHATKCPFSVHAANGRVALPVRDLVSSSTNQLPPVVRGDQLGKCEKTDFIFKQSLEYFESVVERVCPPHPKFGGTDIEDLVCASRKSQKT